ncbi:hypothetical protein [uncultured Paracoccus sp.]|uniref:hypothetical protein n=1 Tax=uncultured Paracoccus sp. TaxID=189685 RepID=UPI002605B810|nr:hypothetical protein [uncultured Paracoccus sp.]
MFKIVTLFLLAATTSAAAQGITSSELRDGFLGERFQWKHVAGVGGETIHNADGTMTYDSDGVVRDARWTFSDGTFCVNAGENDELCITLVANGDGFAAEDGSLTYAPIE